MFDSTARRGASILARVLSALALCAVLCAPAVAQRPAGGLVAHYPLDGSLDDVTTNAYDGQANGGPTYAAGLAGEALRFDGIDDALRFTRLPNSVFAGDFTVSWYMNAQSLDEWSLLSKRDACASGNWFEMGGVRAGSDQLAFNLARGGLGTTLATARQNWFAPGWLHVAVVRRGTEAVVYVDGDAGVAATLPTLNFSGISALLGFSNSPCIGTGGVRAYQGLLDEIRVYNRALTAREIDGLASIAQLTVTPSSIAPGGSLSYTATELDIGKTYTLKLFDGAANPVLDSFSATAVEQRRRVTMPNAAAGRWPLSLQVASPIMLRVSTHASTTLTVAQGLGLVVRTAQPQAGKSLLVDVSRLAPGRLQLRYAGRIVFGPVTLDGTSTTRSLKFVAPSDIPPTFPANVELRAEMLVGRSVARNGTAQVSVAAPFSGPFALPTGVTTSVPVASQNTRVNVRGRLQLADGTTPADVQFSAYWVGSDGTFTPLPTHALAIAPDGTFDLATRPPGLATMTAGIANGAGRVRMVTRRVGAAGRPEYETYDGPSLETFGDTDPQTDITFNIRRVGGNIDEPVSGALIVLDSIAPIQEFDLPPGPPGGGNSDYVFSGDAFSNNMSINDNAVLSSAGPLQAVNQADTFQTIEVPDPPCGPDLFRRYTDANGRASIDLLERSGAVRGGQTRPWAQFVSRQFRATECSGGRCLTSTESLTKFRARIYTAHRGAGVLTNGREDPLVFEFSYNRAENRFTITNLRNGQTTTSGNSVNLSVQVPVLSASSNYAYIQAPFVYALPPAFGTVTRTTGNQDYGLREVTFSGWISFARSLNSPQSPEWEFLIPAPQFNLSFFHRPDAGGALTGAKLYLKPNAGATESLYGNFVRAGSGPVCTLQEDGSFTGNQLWELRLNGEDWRNPERLGALMTSRTVEPSSTGRIEFRNAAGAVGNYPVIFEWKAPPDDILALADVPNPVPVKVNDIKVGAIQLLGTASLGSDARQREFPPTVGGNTVLGTRTKRNESATSQIANASLDGQGGSSGSSIISGDVAKQYNEGPRNRSRTVSTSGSLANFGARDYTTLLSEEVPLLQVTWGIPGLAGVDAYASLRLLAQYWFGGQAGKDANDRAYLEALTDAVFAVGISIGIDIDVLFGLLFDAGVNINGDIRSSMQTSYRSDRADPVDVDNCLNLLIYLGLYFDPCPICPTPAVTETYEVMNQGSTCPSPLGALAATPLALPARPQGGLDIGQLRSLRRHAAMRFDDRGNGGMMALNDARNLSYTFLTEDNRPPVVLSTAPGQRQPTIVFYAPNRAISVWVENALTAGELGSLNTNGYNSPGFGIALRNQRLAWSKFNGSSWTPKQFLTLPGTGEAFPVLQACVEGAAGCPVGGSVFLAFQRDISSNYLQSRNRIHHASWTPAGGWSAVTATPSGGDATQDITPSVAFVDGKPLLTWIRVSSANPLTLQRRLAWQFPGLGPVASEALPNGANSVSLIAQPNLEAGRNMFGAFVVPETNTGIIGSGQAMYLLRGLCSGVSAACDFAFVKASVDGEPGSAVYGDRPNVLLTNSGKTILMRVYSFTPKDPTLAAAVQSRAAAAFDAWRGAKDPLQQQAALRRFELIQFFFGSSAEQYRMTVNFVNGKVVPTAITADGGNYLGMTSTYDRFRDRILTVGAPMFATETAVSLRAQAASGALSRSVPSRSLQVVDGLELRETDDVPDLRVDDVRLTAGVFGPSAALQATVTVTNAGSAFRGASDGPVQLHLRLGAPTGRGLPLASATIPDLGSGERREFVLAFTAPTTAFNDEENMLYANLVLDNDTPDLNGENNFNVLPLPGLPVPQTLLASARKGMPVTQLQWHGSSDPRVVGYRVYRRETNGRFVPLGASAVEGFLDLSAQFGVMRSYAVSSYSRRGVESELSEPTSAAPEAALSGPQGDDLFRNGFEALVP